MLAAPAQAQVSAADKAAAEALFDRGLALLREGKLEEACDRLEQSQAIERGIGTMLYLAECYEKRGKTASAWALFREATSEAQAAGQVERANAGRQRAERLEPLLSRLTIDVPEAVRVPGLEVLRNGTVVPAGVWGMPVPVDPGENRIEARAPGYLSYEQVLAVENGPGAWRLELPALAPSPVVASAEPAPSPSAPYVPSPEPSVGVAPAARVDTGEGGMSTQRVVGIVLGSAGAALAVLGGGFGIRALKKNNAYEDAKDQAATDPELARQNRQDYDDASKATKISNVGVFGGAALLAGGLVTYFLAPERRTNIAFSIDSRGGALSVRGAF